MDAKSVLTTSPQPAGAAEARQGPHRAVGRGVVRGAAGLPASTSRWTAGATGRTARLDGPVFNKSMSRFYFEFDWDGRELFLQSRAMDETGYVQPTKDELRKMRGVNSIYHNNGIQTWRVSPSGEVENVEIA